MSHSLSIAFSQKPKDGGVVSVQNLTVRERLLRLLLENPQKLTIIVPGNTVESVGITEIGGDGRETV